ncbi:hypothetical protein GCM10025783_20620 [Amnibacterium soli]|uniref:Uncharacterized protein n=1 Tax=Amnibacterium soli TaxID=1282736 RepID=A0ABP8Z7V8_9MICO
MAAVRVGDGREHLGQHPRVVVGGEGAAVGIVQSHAPILPEPRARRFPQRSVGSGSRFGAAALSQPTGAAGTDGPPAEELPVRRSRP